MKKSLNYVLISLLLITLALLVSCGNGAGNNDKVKVEFLPLENLSEYKLVRSETAPEECKQAMMSLRSEISDTLGVELSVSTDYVPNVKEILIGKTKREQSQDATADLNEMEFVIKQMGSKVIIAGGSDEATVNAVNYFIENCIDKENGTLMVPQGNGYKHDYKVKIKTMTICGTSIKEFKIKSLYENENAEILRKALYETYVGYNLPIHEEDMSSKDHYIVLDNTALSYCDYSITAENGNLYIRGSYTSIQTAISEFFAILDSAGSTLVLQDGGSITGKMDAPEIPYKNKDDLLKILEYFHEDDRLLFGEHLAGGINLNTTIDEYTTAVGEGPSVMDIDFINFRKSSAGQLSRLLCQTVEYAAKGGVITTMHHWLNPADPESDTYRGMLDSLEDWDKVITKGTALNEEWHKELDLAGEFLTALRDAGVSVMYRPMHEANGNWFWFCAVYPDMGIISSEQMIDMWKYVYHYYTDDLGLNNILWSYSPNNSNYTSGTKVPLPMHYYYPGDEYCDVVGMDWYTNDKYEIDGDAKSWNALLGYNKPTGICEWGLGSQCMAEDPSKQSELFNCENYIVILERMVSEGKNIAFAEVYTSKFGAPSYIGKGEALANSSLIVSLEEMPSVIAEILK